MKTILLIATALATVGVAHAGAGLSAKYLHMDEKYHTQGLDVCLDSGEPPDFKLDPEKCNFPAGSWTRCMHDGLECGTVAENAEYRAEELANLLTEEEWHSDLDKIVALGKSISGRGDAAVVAAVGQFFGNGVEILVADAAAAPRLLATYCNVSYHLNAHSWKLRVHVNDRLVASCAIH